VAAPAAQAPRSQKRLSYKEKRELEELPSRIDALESEQKALGEKIAGPDFYKEGGDVIKASLARVETLKRDLAAVYARWDELDSRR
jgi:ATP-binding cassette subfamily F protein uup